MKKREVNKSLSRKLKKTKLLKNCLTFVVSLLILADLRRFCCVCVFFSYNFWLNIPKPKHTRLYSTPQHLFFLPLIYRIRTI